MLLTGKYDVSRAMTLDAPPAPAENQVLPALPAPLAA